MVRRVAYVFSYCNGVRENSVGVLRCLGTGDKMEATLELLGVAQKKMLWKLYYFDEYGGLTEGSAKWVRTRAYGKSELSGLCCRLCPEAGLGEGIVLLPYEEGEEAEKSERRDISRYLCGRYDGAEVPEARIKELLCKKEPGESGQCIRSAKRLMEEITRAAEGVREETIRPAERLLSKRPAYRPCRTEEITHSVRVTPGELKPFEEDGQDYRENSFLLHGYYEYRHLLFGRRKRGERYEYVVMVPGRYGKKESRLADAFGFPDFIPADTLQFTESSAKAPFGYWCGKM